MSHLKSFSPEDLIALANLMALAFAEEFDTDDLNVLGNWVVAVGSIMLTIAAQQQLLSTQKKEQQQEQKPDVQQQIKELQDQLKALQKQPAKT